MLTFTGGCALRLHMQGLSDPSSYLHEGVGITAEETEARRGGATCSRSSIVRHCMSNCQMGVSAEKLKWTEMLL